MRTVFISLFALINSIMTTDIVEVRSLYRHARQSAENTEKFYQLVKETGHQENHILSAYYGCALTLKASFADSRGDKISFFRQGKKRIEEAIASDPENIELRMIRLSVQTNAPRITRYYKNIELDKKFLLDNVEKTSPTKLKEFVKGFMSKSKAFAD